MLPKQNIFLTCILSFHGFSRNSRYDLLSSVVNWCDDDAGGVCVRFLKKGIPKPGKNCAEEREMTQKIWVRA